jgi:hypothetical protein
MPITGMESTLKSQLVAAIQAGIAAECGYAVMTPNCINGLAKGIADAIIPFLVANIQVNPGQAVTGVVTTGAGAGGAVVGASSAPGTIT